eukprot:5106220-Amphidinium_carterae.1
MDDRLVLTIKQSRVEELKQLVTESLHLNVMPIRTLRKLVGKELYSALYEEEARASAPRECCWVKQIRPALLWFHASLNKQSGPIERIYRYNSFAPTRLLIIITDASPWALGRALVCEEGFWNGSTLDWRRLTRQSYTL